MMSQWDSWKNVERLWELKDRLGKYFATEQSKKIYFKARNTLFPEDISSSKLYKNRAGDKLIEVMNMAGIDYPTDADIRWFDIAGGPGAWSKALLDTFPNSTGVGVTLKVKDQLRLNWYPELAKEKRWTAEWGADGDGNLYSNANKLSITKKYKLSMDLCVADGGIDVEGDKFDENLQELYNVRLITGEILVALGTLKPGGNFICKLFDTFSDITASLIYACSCVFESVLIIKPSHSRAVNSERYLVCKGAKKFENRKEILKILMFFNNEFNIDSNSVAETLFDFQYTRAFNDSLRSSVRYFTRQQTDALERVLNYADKLMANPTAIPAAPPATAVSRKQNPSKFTAKELALLRENQRLLEISALEARKESEIKTTGSPKYGDPGYHRYPSLFKKG